MSSSALSAEPRIPKLSLSQSSQHKTVRRLVQKARTNISERPSLYAGKKSLQSGSISVTQVRSEVLNESPTASFRKIVPVKMNSMRPPEAPSLDPKQLSEDAISALYKKASTFQSFATNLMTHLFTKTELQACKNVYGRSQGRPTKYQKSSNESALDAERVELIRRAVEKHVKDRKDAWASCVLAMNLKINSFKKISNTTPA